MTKTNFVSFSPKSGEKNIQLLPCYNNNNMDGYTVKGDQLTIKKKCCLKIINKLHA